VAAVLEAANLLSRCKAYALEKLSYRVYIRHAKDYPAIRDVLFARLGATADVVYLQADICRADLLVEIEAMASQSLGNC
jgi:chorismate lyase / 3-hydroxybenzoate synthase